MFDWLSNKHSGEFGFDVDATTLTETLETPAPVFAVRAFRHAVYGTPNLDQPGQRRHSASDQTRPQNLDLQAKRPMHAPPILAGHPYKTTGDEDTMQPDPMPSPNKGILLTPGTAAARRKTVSFGEEVPRNDGKRASKTGLPHGYPDKLSSTWIEVNSNQTTHEMRSDQMISSNKVKDALEQARRTPSKIFFDSKRPTKPIDETKDNVKLDLPRSPPDLGEYWKNEYDIYREKSMQDCKKLVLKQKAARDRAREKQVQCTGLVEELRLERVKVDRLERRAADLEAQMLEFREMLRISRANEMTAKSEIECLKRSGASLIAKDPRAVEVAENLRQDRETDSAHSALRPHPLREAEKQLRSTTSAVTRLGPEDQYDVPRARTDQSRPRRAPSSTRLQTACTVGAPSSSANTSCMNVLLRLESGGTMVTNGIDAIPLQALSGKVPLRQESLMISTSTSKSAAHRIASEPSAQDLSSSYSELHKSRKKDGHCLLGDDKLEGISLQLVPSRGPLPSSLVQHKTEALECHDNDIMTELSSTVLALHSATEGNACSMLDPDQGVPETQSKPLKVWTAMNIAASQPRRHVGKDGQEIGADRLAAAKARLQARGRKVS